MVLLISLVPKLAVLVGFLVFIVWLAVRAFDRDPAIGVTFIAFWIAMICWFVILMRRAFRARRERSKAIHISSEDL